MRSPMLFWRMLLAVTSSVAFAAAWNTVTAVRTNNIVILHSRWLLLLAALVLLGILSTVLLSLTWSRYAERLLDWLDRLFRLKGPWLTAGWILFATFVMIYPAIYLHPIYGRFLQGRYLQVGTFWLLALAGMTCMKSLRKEFSWQMALAVSAITQAAVYSIVLNFSQVNDYPFSLGWLETTPFYSASILFANKLYGISLPLPLMNETVVLMRAAPFFIGNVPIWIHRAWFAILSVGLTIALAAVIIRRWRVRGNRMIFLVAAWIYIYLMQGPVQAHLLACAIILIASYRPQEFWLATVGVFLASIWAGISRINWYPVPGLFAAVLYLLEVPVEASGSRLRYMWMPVFWFIFGTAVAFGSQFAYIHLSGNASQPGGAFTSLTSDLLWYRLLPGAANRVGILLAAILVSLPLLALIVYFIRHKPRHFHPLRLIGVFAALLVLFLGGLVVSIKIGGGTDLHNLDAYLILLMLVSGYFYFDRIKPDTDLLSAPVSFPGAIIVPAILIPIWLGIQLVNPIFTWDHAQADQVLSTIRSQVKEADRDGSEVLFISQRHLLALKMVDVPLVPEYEQEYLMEMVMSHNRAYLDRFQQDLQARRFGMIVAAPYSTGLQGSKVVWGTENDLWVQDVVIPLNCYYERIENFDEQEIALYTARDQPCQ